MSNVQTDNSFLEGKIKLRVDNLPTNKVRVLDCFGGNGEIWELIKARNPKKIKGILRIDQKQARKGIYLIGNNVKFLQNLDLRKFNVIDLDAYGVPYKQLAAVFAHKFTQPTAVFVTFIQSMFGRLPLDLLVKLGYSETMIKKCPTIFNRHGIEKLKGFLSLHGVKEIKRYFDLSERKHYLYFLIKPRKMEE